MKIFLLFSYILAIAPWLCNRATPSAAPVPISDKINGLTFVAPPEPFSDNPFVPIQSVGANWIAVVPYGFTMPGKPSVHYDAQGGQWWGEKPAGICETIRLAHENRIKVMLKPQVYVPDGWTGSLDFGTPEGFAAWESDYEKYILPMARLADSMHVELFCIGTEFGTITAKRPQFWSQLIDKIKSIYSGKLTYSSNWDDWERAPFWDKLDYIGLGGYFPLVEDTMPRVEQLTAAWQPIKERLHDLSTKYGKPILFTEFGYLSVDQCGWRNWELEQNIQSRRINEHAQANCYEALFSVFGHEKWWAGSFLWKWFPNMRGHEGYPERDYTPQGKIGEKTLQKWYKGTAKE